ncbi:hypothetical protein TrST_g10308 [Triparma strigata]|uniref:Cilia- and flagella-associated protein 36 n=1 Tax=Triparma strigata TaxID=1606541 RepID=A0A9W7BL84_9STRA|nr:hypothetical protein TrST_g10308 [Triparma strigata]
MSGDEWIFESVAQILKSPAWEAEVYGFVDEHCVIFDNDDENKFAYTDLHAEFKGIVERHLNSKLAEFGIGEETFYEACESNRFKNDINKNVYMQMVAMDDFLTFKKLMVRRNMELELEAVKALQNASAPLTAPKSDADAEAEFQAALKASEDMTPAERVALMSGAGESKDSGEAGAGANGESEMEEQLKAAIQANMTEMELFHKQEEFEQLQLEQAIAASLAMHEDELREAKMEAKRIDSMDSDMGLIETTNSSLSMEDSEPKKPAASGSMLGESESESESEDERSQEDTVNYGGTPAKATSPTFDELQADDDQKDNLTRTIDAAQAKVLEENVVDAKAIETPKKKAPVDDEKEVQTAEPVLEADVLTGQVVEEEEAVKVVKKKKKEKKEKKKKKKREKEDFKLEDGPTTLNNLRALPVLGGIEPGKKSFDSPVKPLSELQDDMASRKKQAEEAFRKNHELLNEQKRQQEEMRKAAQLTEADMASRAMHLRRQRDLIVAKKKAEREKAADNARAKEAAQAEQFKQKIANFNSGRDAEDSDKNKKDEGAKETSSEDLTAQERRASMRIALAARMKRDMLIAEEERLTKLQSDQFAELDEKLKRVEELREENRMREDDLKEAIRQNQNLRALNIHRSGINK